MEIRSAAWHRLRLKSIRIFSPETTSLKFDASAPDVIPEPGKTDAKLAITCRYSFELLYRILPRAIVRVTLEDENGLGIVPGKVRMRMG